MRILKAVLIMLCVATAVTSAKSLLIIPVSGDSNKNGDLHTVNRLYSGFVEGQYPGQIQPLPDSLPPCGQRDCALKAAASAKADEVIYSELNLLGTKWVFTSTLINADGSGSFSQTLTSLSIEDMDAVTRRMADALLNRKNVEQVATVDNLTEKESADEPMRRRSLHSTGISVGYIFPVDHSFSYLKSDNAYPTPSYSQYQPYSQIIRLGLMHNWQFRDNLLLNGDMVWGPPDVLLGSDLNLDYLLKPGDYAPFLGGGLGLYYSMLHDENTNNKNYSGLALNLQGGMMLFRTYDVNVMLRGQYQMILNSDIDNGYGIDVGITYRANDDERREEARSSNGPGFFAVVGYIVVGLLALGLVSSIVNH